MQIASTPQKIAPKTEIMAHARVPTKVQLFCISLQDKEDIRKSLI